MMRGKIKALLLDLEGTLYFKGAPIPGAVEALDRLKQMGLELRFLTNIDSKTTETIKADLAQMGLPLPVDRIFTPATAALQFLRQNPGKRCYCLLSEELSAAFAPYLQGDGPVDYVIVGDFRESVSYERLNTAFRHIVAGAEIVALQKGRYFVRQEGHFLDTGAFVAMLEYGSGKTARVLGKPSQEFFQLALSHMGCTPAEASIVGDDISTDIAGAANTGALGVLVQTGKYSVETTAASAVRPDHEIGSIADLPRLLQQLA